MPRPIWARRDRGEAAVARLHFPGLHPDAAAWLIANRAIAAIGIDTASIDYGQSTAFASHRSPLRPRHSGVREPHGPRTPAAARRERDRAADEDWRRQWRPAAGGRHPAAVVRHVPAVEPAWLRQPRLRAARPDRGPARRRRRAARAGRAARAIGSSRDRRRRRGLDQQPDCRAAARFPPRSPAPRPAGRTARPGCRRTPRPAAAHPRPVRRRRGTRFSASRASGKSAGISRRTAGICMISTSLVAPRDRSGTSPRQSDRSRPAA